MIVMRQTLTIAQLENFVPSRDGKEYENVSEVSLISLWDKYWPFEQNFSNSLAKYKFSQKNLKTNDIYVLS